jgi:hypothetical protein
MPVFLYCPGVAEGVEITLQTGDGITLLGYLFMRTEHFNDWSFTPPGELSLAGTHFDEGTFFGLILSLLP